MLDSLFQPPDKDMVFFVIDIAIPPISISILKDNISCVFQDKGRLPDSNAVWLGEFLKGWLCTI